jgi:antitoxin component of RelBE/YafQ-DinJ toxin-antitoxin module
MREKGKHIKTSKILIRVNKEEKKAAEELSVKAGMNTSEYIRGLLREAKMSDQLSFHLKILEKYQKTLAKFRTLLNATVKKRKG